MITWIVGIYVFLGVMTYCSLVFDKLFKRQDVIIKFLNEAITGKDLPRNQWPLLEPHKKSYVWHVRFFLATVSMWPWVFSVHMGE